jgi:hypothetical protein
VRLTLDHVIVRTEDPAGTLRDLSARLHAPVLAGVEEVAGIRSGILRAGVDIEVVALGKDPPPLPRLYGIGFVADVPIEDAVRELRALGFPCSAPLPGKAGGRRWRAAQVHGLLADPMKLPVSTTGKGDAAAVVAARVAGRIPLLARLATRDAGRSMVVVTEYGFDAGVWRVKAGDGPAVEAVEVCGEAWTRFPVADDRLEADPDGPAAILRVRFAGGLQLP